MYKDTEDNINANTIYEETKKANINRTNPCFSSINDEEKHSIINRNTLINTINYFNVPKYPVDSSTNNIKNINIINCNESSLFNNNYFNNKLLLNYNINKNILNPNINNNFSNSNFNINREKNNFNNNYKENTYNKISEYNFNKNYINNNFIQNKDKIDLFNNSMNNTNEISEDNSNLIQNQFINYINSLKMPLTKFLSTKKGIYQMENYLNVNKNVNISILLRLLNKEGLPKLMKNIFGNYFIQGIIKNANYSQIIQEHM